MTKLLGRELPKRPPPKRKVGVRRTTGTKKPVFSRPERQKPKTEYDTHTHVHMYKHKKVKSFKGPTAKDEAKLLVSRLKSKDPNSKYTIKTERVPKKKLF